MRSPFRKQGVRIGAVALAAILIALTAGELLGWLQGVDRHFSDLYHNMAGKRFEPQHVVLVSIDDQTLGERRAEPLVFWGPHYAKVIERLRLAGVRIIGIDVRFLISAETWLHGLGVEWDRTSRTFDGAFRKELGQGQVVLVASLNTTPGGEIEVIPPVEDYRYSLPRVDADLGLDALFPDPDGVIRNFVPAWFSQGPPPRLTLAARLAIGARGADPLAENWRIEGIGMINGPEPQAIAFCGPPGTHRPVSFGSLLGEAVDERTLASLRNKVVIIGMDFANAQDVHSTPYTSGWFGEPGRLMSGPEIHANIVETILSGRSPQQVPAWISLLLMIGLVLVGAWLFFRCGPLGAAAIGLGLAAGLVTLAYGCFRANWMLPVAGTHLALLLCYLGSIGLRLSGEERSRARLQNMFGRYVSDEIVDMLVQSGRQPDLGGETKPISVLFSDIRNFTTISESLAPDEVVEMLNTYFSLVTDAILSEGGTIDKFIGDAVMAVFGSPIEQVDHARRALRTALQISRIADGFRDWMTERFPARDLPVFDIGIGVHSGLAVVGNIGSKRRMEFTAIGDTVNTASRLEGVTKQRSVRIIISAATRQAAGEDLRIGPADLIQVKGRRQAIEVHAFLGFSDHAASEE